jgi:hypothetical protein
MHETKFVVCVRHPFDAIASFKSVGGSVSRGQEYAVAFNRDLNREVRRQAGWRVARRRVELYAQLQEAILPHLERPERFVARYEGWFEAGGRQWASLADFLGVDLPPTPIRLRHESKRSLLSDSERAYIRHRCGHIAEALGYDLD